MSINTADFLLSALIIALVFWPVAAIARLRQAPSRRRLTWASIAFLSAVAPFILLMLLLPPSYSHVWGLALPLFGIGPWSVLLYFRREFTRKHEEASQ